MNVHANKIAVLLPSLEGGGAERSMLNLVNAFLARGRDVELVLCRAKGAYLETIPDTVKIVELEPTGEFLARWLAAIANIKHLSSVLKPVVFAGKIAPEIARLRALRLYLKDRQPDVLLSAITYTNLVAVWAKGAPTQKVPVVVSERIALSSHCTTPSSLRKWRWRYLPPLVRQSYPGADAVVAVSNQVADDLIDVVGLSKQLVETIYNPVVDDHMRARAQEPLPHEWFESGAVPVILGVGRLTEQKDFSTLLRAFAKVRADREVRLVILGEGKEDVLLEDLAQRLGVGTDVQLPGFVENPFQYMARASVFVLSSEYEGLPGVLIQALACGCPVVSTNCPGGSAEILDNGKYGPLVSVGDEVGMAKAILSQLENPPDRDRLRQRAEDFSVERAANRYLELLDSVVEQSAARE